MGFSYTPPGSGGGGAVAISDVTGLTAALAAKAVIADTTVARYVNIVHRDSPTSPTFDPAVATTLLEGWLMWVISSASPTDHPYQGLYVGHSPDGVATAVPTLHPRQPQIGDVYYSHEILIDSGGSGFYGEAARIYYCGIDVGANHPHMIYMPPNDDNSPPTAKQILSWDDTENSLVWGDSTGIAYDHTTSGLAATNVGAAIDELKAAVDALTP